MRHLGSTVTPPKPPVISPRVLRWFRVYLRSYLGRHFHGINLASDGRPGGIEGHPVVVFLNHAAWWDPLVALFLAEKFFPGRPGFAPIEATQLERYGLLGKLGFFGVKPGSAHGARVFLEASESILADSRAMLWLTPQAKFCDVRVRPLEFTAGLGALARRHPEVLFLPLALEYAFWDERLPEVFARFGRAVSGEGLRAQALSPGELTARLSQNLAQTMNTLAAAVRARDSGRFTPLLRGASGVNFLYDRWRWLQAKRRGQPFASEHHPRSAL